jgi:MFS superfamily sulfate permease-like transporter
MPPWLKLVRTPTTPASLSWAERLRADVPASLVTFLVALPLSLGIALASGAPPALGLVTGIIGGLLGGALAGAPLMVSGPAAGLVVLVGDAITEFGLESLGLIVLFAGVLQVLGGALGVARWFRATSPAVLRGMLAGIGLVIIASQLHLMVDALPVAGALDNLRALPAAFARAADGRGGPAHPTAAALGVGTVLLLIGWERFRPAVLQSVPGALVAVGAATLLNAAVGLPVATVALPADFGSVLRPPGPAAWEAARTLRFWEDVLGLALIASAESLLCAAAVDRLHNGPRTDWNRELMAQGAGNVLCGVVGGLPMTGVIVRSAANVSAGARSRGSAMLHGLWLLLVVLVFPGVLEAVPRAALAAVLVATGWSLVDPRGLRALRRTGAAEVGIFAATAATIVAVDLLVGVAVGFGLALLRVVLATVRADVETVEDPTVEDGWEVRVSGVATFLSLPRMLEELEALPPRPPVRLSLGGLRYVDAAVVEAVEDWVARRRGAGQPVDADLAALRARAGLPPAPPPALRGLSHP